MKNEILLAEWASAPDMFNTYSTTIDKILKGINDLQVHDIASCKLAINTSSDVKMILKDILSIRKKTTDPYKKFINLVNESAKEFTDKLMLIQKIITQKVSAYDIELTIQSEMAQKESENLSESLESDFNIIALNDQKIGSTAKTIVTHKIERDFSITNESLIPREYLKVDEDKIKQAIKLGVNHIPGIVITETKKLILRKR